MTLKGTLGSAGDRVDLLISKGDDFGPHEVTLVQPDGITPVNLTAATIAAVMKKVVTDTDPAATFTVVITDAPAGKFTFALGKAVTAALVSGPTETDAASHNVWDMKFTDSTGKRVPVFYGAARVKPSVT